MMRFTPRELLARVKMGVAGESLALMVFGSTARGDEDFASDIDILQLAKVYKPSYKSGDLNVSVYTPQSLTKVARSGGLFVLHLIVEGVILDDPQSALANCLREYSPPRSYDPLRRELRNAAQLLNVSMGFYRAHWERCHSVALFILRSFLYAQAAESCRHTFSIRRIASDLRDPRIAAVYQLKNASGPDPELWSACIRLTLEYLGTTFSVDQDSMEATVVNAFPHFQLTVSLGLRLLGAAGAVTYHQEA